MTTTLFIYNNSVNIARKSFSYEKTNEGLEQYADQAESWIKETTKEIKDKTNITIQYNAYGG